MCISEVLCVYIRGAVCVCQRCCVCMSEVLYTLNDSFITFVDSMAGIEVVKQQYAASNAAKAEAEKKMREAAEHQAKMKENERERLRVTSHY